jgi:hypothetical protein
VVDAVTESGLPAERLGAVESISLLRALSAVPDPRKARRIQSVVATPRSAGV